MMNKKVISVLVIVVAIVAIIAASSGIFSHGGNGPYEYQSIRGRTVTIHGDGLYRHMSSDVAIQGIAQDYVTLFIAVPLLLTTLIFSMKRSLRARFLLAGILNYFLVTYLFYLEIAMYNEMFLAYVILTGTSFFAFFILLLTFDIQKIPVLFNANIPVKFIGGFLISNSIIIAMLWLSVVLPPLIDGSVIPDAVQHYTTLTVQGLDLAIFLPISFVSGFLLIKKKTFGYLMSTVTLVFLPLLMTALTAKIIAMALTGVNVIPAVFIIPSILIISIICSLLMLRNINEPYPES
ncbi:MAG: hypothetical protein RBR81_06185 [Bacteroidales bacterium]|jgi:hypothetical protein|nr:hypothetical protein [Bacteroidales bacterium]